MKKMIIGIQVLIGLLILLKVASFSGILSKAEYLTEPTSIATAALAQTNAQEIQVAKPQTVSISEGEKQKTKNPMEDVLSEQRDLAAALAAKKMELDNRENALRVDEQRLIALRKDITEKIALLRAQEEKIATQLDANREDDIKRFKDMAKVYEATPPAKAGPMMEKLDTKTAAGITMHMKKDKAGALWAYITPQKAVEITKEITRNGGYRVE